MSKGRLGAFASIITLGDLQPIWPEILNYILSFVYPGDDARDRKCSARGPGRYTPSMDPLKIYDYLTKSRERVFDAVRPLTLEQYHRSFAFGLKTIARTLTHVMISEWYYIERLEGRSVPPYEQWPIKDEHPPAFDVIENRWREQADSVRASVAAERDWKRSVTYLSFPDDSRGSKLFHITATAGDFFTQLALHEVHHRAQVMAMLRELGPPAQSLEDIDYNDLMYERQAVLTPVS